VGGQIRSDAERAKPSLKDELQREHGLALGFDYNLLAQWTTADADEDSAVGGVARFFGHWTPFHGRSDDPGSLVFKIEHRHRLGTDLPPQALGPSLGYAGITAATWSDAKGLLTNLYWTQSFADNRVAFNAGIVDATDYIDVYGLVNAWTEFSDLAFSTNPTIPAPSQGLGAALRLMPSEHAYVVVGIADANGDPHDPAGMPESFFGDAEHFRHLEVGWIGSWDTRYADNAHLVVWQVDDRAAAGVEGGWGATLSLSRQLGGRWFPFVRAGWAEGGGGLVDRSVSAGFAHEWSGTGHRVGFGANWGRSPEGDDGTGGLDQYAFQAYGRINAGGHVAVIPSVERVVNPALASSADDFWVFGLGLRVSF